MIILPAIDLLNGKAVRLSRGDYNEVKKYSDEPLAVLNEFTATGASQVHVVDLDGAKAGKPINYQIINNLAQKHFIEVGGGIRTIEDGKNYVDNGVSRVIYGSAVAKDISLAENGVRELGNKFAVGVDAKNEKVAVSGWTQVTDLNSYDFCSTLCDMGVSTIIYTDIDTDGMLSGTNLKAFEKLAKLNMNIIASGGVTTLDEIKILKEMGIYGCIIGKAIYENKIALKDALEIARC